MYFCEGQSQYQLVDNENDILTHPGYTLIGIEHSTVSTLAGTRTTEACWKGELLDLGIERDAETLCAVPPAVRCSGPGIVGDRSEVAAEKRTGTNPRSGTARYETDETLPSRMGMRCVAPVGRMAGAAGSVRGTAGSNP